jgi:hypothetical protein
MNPFKQIVRIIQTKDKTVRVQLSFTFEADDPRAEQIYAGVGACLKEVLTEEEGEGLLKQIAVERAKIATGTEPS